MKTSEQFNKFKNHKGLRALVIQSQDGEKAILRLCIDVVNEITKESTTSFIECETEIKITNYFNYRNKGNFQFGKYSAHCGIRYSDLCHVKTALKAIKPISDVKVKCILFNQTDNYEAVNFVAHETYLQIDDKLFLLDHYVGSDNSASPLQYSTQRTVTVN